MCHGVCQWCKDSTVVCRFSGYILFNVLLDMNVTIYRRGSEYMDFLTSLNDYYGLVCKRHLLTSYSRFAALFVSPCDSFVDIDFDGVFMSHASIRFPFAIVRLI